MPDNRCKIWPEFIAKKVAHSKDESRVIDVIDSPRAGGTYRIDRESAEWCAPTMTMNLSASKPASRLA